VPLKIVPRATLGTRAVGCRLYFYICAYFESPKFKFWLWAQLCCWSFYVSPRFVDTRVWISPQPGKNCFLL